MIGKVAVIERGDAVPVLEDGSVMISRNSSTLVVQCSRDPSAEFQLHRGQFAQT